LKKDDLKSENDPKEEFKSEPESDPKEESKNDPEDDYKIDEELKSKSEE